jgi:predicted  nucleic acid-binding Zn-ribbon protein
MEYLYTKMEQRIRSLERTLDMFMRETKAERLTQEDMIKCLSEEMNEFHKEQQEERLERLSQEDTIQSLSEEMEEVQGEMEKFQEEFYDCQSDVQERIDLIEDALKETIELVWKLEAELRTIKERTPVKDKMA